VLMPLLIIFQLYHGCQFYLLKETGVSGKNHRPASSHWQTFSHIVVWQYTSLWVVFILATLVW